MAYQGIGPNAGLYVKTSDSTSYALEKCGLREDKLTDETIPAKIALRDWYFSGNWIEVEDGEDRQWRQEFGDWVDGLLED